MKNSVDDGYSFNEETIFIKIFYINGEFYNDGVYDTIQHEVEHYWQCKRRGGSLSSSHYQNVRNLLGSEDKFENLLGQILYFSKHFEIDAYVNGAYNIAIKYNLFVPTLNDFIEMTTIKFLIEKLKELRREVEKFNFEKYGFKEIQKLKKNLTLVNNLNKEQLIKLIDRTYKYLIAKCKMVVKLLNKNRKNGRTY